LIFFFSSRRRHTRFSRDWSSDVCSSDLKRLLKQYANSSGKTLTRLIYAPPLLRPLPLRFRSPFLNRKPKPSWALRVWVLTDRQRSEERRVGKECRARGAWKN